MIHSSCSRRLATSRSLLSHSPRRVLSFPFVLSFLPWLNRGISFYFEIACAVLWSFCFFVFFFLFLLLFFCLFSSFILLSVCLIPSLALGFHVWIYWIYMAQNQNKRSGSALPAKDAIPSLQLILPGLPQPLCSPRSLSSVFRQIIVSLTQPRKNTRTLHNVRKPGVFPLYHPPPPTPSQCLGFHPVSSSLLLPGPRLSPRFTANLLPFFVFPLPSTCRPAQLESIKSSLLEMVVSGSRVLPFSSSNNISTMNTTRR